MEKKVEERVLLVFLFLPRENLCGYSSSLDSRKPPESLKCISCVPGMS